MENLPGDWPALLGVAFLFGMRHGFDADHLAAVDGLTRLNWRARPALARGCGALFSMGHGVVVMAVAAAVAAASARWTVPGWLGEAGAWISIGVLALLGAANLHAALTTPADQPVLPVGLRSRLFRFRARQPLAVAGVGALFALSFDTLSQAALFALAGNAFGGVGHALALGAGFTTGMLLADGVNGLWIARLLAGADRAARLASRVMALAVAGTSLLVAGLGCARQLWPAAAAWTAGRELAFGGVLIVVLAASYLSAVRGSAQAAR